MEGVLNKVESWGTSNFQEKKATFIIKQHLLQWRKE